LQSREHFHRNSFWQGRGDRRWRFARLGSPYDDARLVCWRGAIKSVVGFQPIKTCRKDAKNAKKGRGVQTQRMQGFRRKMSIVENDSVDFGKTSR